jgi:hypothetical protein
MHGSNRRYTSEWHTEYKQHDSKLLYSMHATLTSLIMEVSQKCRRQGRNVCIQNVKEHMIPLATEQLANAGDSLTRRPALPTNATPHPEHPALAIQHHTGPALLLMPVATPCEATLFLLSNSPRSSNICPPWLRGNSRGHQPDALLICSDVSQTYPRQRCANDLNQMQMCH